MKTSKLQLLNSLNLMNPPDPKHMPHPDGTSSRTQHKRNQCATSPVRPPRMPRSLFVLFALLLALTPFASIFAADSALFGDNIVVRGNLDNARLQFEQKKTVSLTTAERLGQQTVFHYEWKQDGPHTIKIVKKSGQYLYLDGFRVTRRSAKEIRP